MLHNNLQSSKLKTIIFIFESVCEKFYVNITEGKMLSLKMNNLHYIFIFKITFLHDINFSHWMYLEC